MACEGCAKRREQMKAFAQHQLARFRNLVPTPEIRRAVHKKDLTPEQQRAIERPAISDIDTDERTEHGNSSSN